MLTQELFKTICVLKPKFFCFLKREKERKSRFTTGTIFCSEPERQPGHPLMSRTCTDLRAYCTFFWVIFKEDKGGGGGKVGECFITDICFSLGNYTNSGFKSNHMVLQYTRENISED